MEVDVITFSEWQQAMLQKGVERIATGASVPTYRVMRDMYEQGLINEDDMINYYMNIGYRENDAETLLSLQMLDAGVRKPKRKRKPNLVVEADMKQKNLFPDGLFAKRVGEALIILLMIVSIPFVFSQDLGAFFTLLATQIMVALWCMWVMSLS